MNAVVFELIVMYKPYCKYVSFTACLMHTENWKKMAPVMSLPREAECKISNIIMCSVGPSGL